VCAVFPYIILSILCVKALTLEGASEGLKFLFTPEWERLYEAEVWIGEYFCIDSTREI
jgi:SNF family Na+-dependent transporter